HSCSGSEVHCLLRRRFLPFCLQPCDAHVRAFLSSLVFLQLRFIGFRRSRFRLPLLRELGLELRVSRYSCTLTRCTPPNRVHFQAHLSLLITDWQFASSCFPRTDFAAAVTFSYRSVDLVLTGTFAPLRQRFHSRTTEPLRGSGKEDLRS